MKSVPYPPQKRKSPGRRRTLEAYLAAPLEQDPLELPWIAHPAYTAPPAALTSWESDDAPRSPTLPRLAASSDGTRPDPPPGSQGRVSAPASGAAASGQAGAAGRNAQPCPDLPTRGARRPRLDTPTTSCNTALDPYTGETLVEQRFRDDVARLVSARWPQRAKELNDCGRSGIVLGCKACGAYSVVPFRCRSRTCPHAQRAAAAKISERMLQRIRIHDALMEAQPWDGLGRKRARSWRLLTLTSPISRIPEANWDPDKMRAGMKRARRAWTKFWRSTPWGQQRRTEKGQRSRRDTSGIVAGEFGPKNAMPHLHILVYGEYVDKAELARLWALALGEPVAHIDVRRIVDVDQGIKEVVKYVAKGVGDDPMPARHAAYVELALRNVHRVSIVGYLRKVKVTDEDGAAEDLRPEDVHDREILCCEDCGVVGEWNWLGNIDSHVIRRIGGFGLTRFEDMYDGWDDPGRGPGPPPGTLPPGFVLVTL